MNKISSFTVVSALLLLGGVFLVQPVSADDRVVHEKSILDVGAGGTGGWLAFIDVTNGPDRDLMLDRIYSFHVLILTDGVTILNSSVPNKNWTGLPPGTPGSAFISTIVKRSVTFNTSNDSIDLGSSRVFGIVTDLPEYEIKWWTTDINREMVNSGKLRIEPKKPRR